ncbi:putative Zinc finger, SWIM-type, MULE transposase domain, FHY3/FAR1 family [Helianthus annuus]|uniref:Protein FAR1-RELATED SEQUENCE n=2 Tax=Helianthus annuus TaxID=4232 RepID=A0A251RSB4_HELAN|nr:protein FAR1-RELATED SEQUENCE 9 isoform X1 [Helianthus annuus]XP_022021213.1 protein FAR1-RELATED SEQUENCE 9 isoform X1 [Helianthus annuus]XP_022021214.1 protein FAR1-RELATED SEQUENCE 9 isoform X1 [Helianthus annuus]KAF5756200.1 putative Zinc finger, SWIM-type, MULE transposase domain, FHY3/FAR1 family [Helianthus annuus]KAJ0434403.1 putative Zinc finger, SWIM-type, MULE transposase domain, FHY3/FAR1 family [Helianthus annuus]KAJ0813916.1 putative Zinc finger, SWIM-type, MULE transposase do
MSRLGSGGDGHLVDYLRRKQAENPSFFYLQSNGNMFWADSTFRINYNYFGDTVRLDTSYKAHHYMLPLVSITGLNHHAQPVLFGCALLNYESDSAYVWLLQNWLHAMSGNYPVSITTEPDHRIQMAVAQVLPQTHHRFCRWSIFRETHEKLAQTCHPTFHEDFRKCIHETETVDEFESCWQALVARFTLADNEWLQSIYSARHQWVPVYMQETFFGELYPTEETSSRNTFFEGYVNATTSMQSLVKQYESAVTGWHEMELKADFETANTTPLLKTPSPMEKQAASLYTRRAFLKFQEELVETLANPATKVEDTTYRVAKFGDGEKAHLVRFNPLEMKAVCSCHMFESSGIICRHALSVFRAKNVLTLPSEYVLKRWSRDANVPSSTQQDSLSVRYNSLRKEAIKFVEEGAKSIHIYNVAQDALQVAANKVAASKKRVNQQSLILNQQTPESDKEKKIRELTSELESTNERCEVYRANLLAVLREMEDQKLKLSVKVQNARLTLKE